MYISGNIQVAPLGSAAADCKEIKPAFKELCPWMD
jgi:hypothetical protein